ncbi:MAG: hypothetical protein OHK0053_06820 [Microscillaceae bacterium]
MCGCYEVEFNFAETFAYPQDTASYKPSKTKHDRGLEWVQKVADEAGKIILQHILIVNDTAIVKHWRQDWLYEHTELWHYNGFNDWKKTVLRPEQVKGQWTQKVYQVDDSPRYEGSASWVHQDGRHYWESTADAPLPRREFTIRKDYNLLKRRNRHEITAYGWLHEQDNDKIIRNEQGQDYQLAQEKGLDIYKKVADEKCRVAQAWWQENQAFWAQVRAKWEAEMAQKQYIKLKKQVEGKPLFMHLFALDPESPTTAFYPIIDNFFEVKK